MRVGITGGSGFIGSHIVDSLVRKGHDVVVYDFVESINNEVTFKYTDILDLRSCLDNIKDIDVLYHMAAISDVNIAIKEKLKTIDVNVKGTANVLEALSQNAIPRIIYASTEWVYSALEKEQFTEVNSVDEESIINIKKLSHIYTQTKYIGELLCEEFCKGRSMDYTILRFGIPYGPRSRNGTVIYNFLKNGLEGKTIQIFGSGRQFRNFIYISDLADGCVAALSEDAINQIINIAGKKAITINEIAETIESIVGPPTTIKHISSRKQDFLGTLVSIKKAKQILGWDPTTNLQDGIILYKNWICEQRESLLLRK